MADKNGSDYIWGSKETQFFYELTPDRILNTIEHHFDDIVCTGLIIQLNSMENRVYEVEFEPRATPVQGKRPRYIAKFYRPGRWTKEQILQEHEFLADLVENDIPVIAPMPFKDGSTLQKMADADIWFTLFPKYMGRMPDELNDEQILQVGRLLARMHNVGATKKADKRLHINPQTFGLQNLEFILSSNRIPETFKKTYSDLVTSLCTVMEPLFAGVRTQRIHGDCHFGNLLHGQDGYFWVDFDDMLNGPPVQDIWLLCPGRDDWAKDQMQHLLHGYEMMRDFDRSTLNLIEPLRTLRMIHFSAWIAKRWDDSAFPRAFPEFGTEKYWHTQVRDLQEQLMIIQQGQYPQDY